MKQLSLILLILIMQLKLRAQALPMEKIALHLMQSHELTDQEHPGKNFEKISMAKYFEIDGKALFCFSSTSVHRYNFLLQQDRDTFQILNCDNFIREYNILEKLFTGKSGDSLVHYILPIMDLYEHNDNYHPSPPIAPPIRLPDGTTTPPKYLPRKLVPAAKFTYTP